LGGILQNRDTAEAVDSHIQRQVNRMKTSYLKMRWLVPLLGLAVAAGGVTAARTYLDLRRRTQSEEAFSAALDRLYADQKISSALRKLHDGEVSAAARRLDLLLCENILVTDSELASASERQRAYVQDAFVRIARSRPRNAETAAGATLELSNDQIKAETILEEACATTRPAREGLAASR
jgi:hypothetical protein